MQLPKLTFSNMTYGKAEVPRDLRRWLYAGGASADSYTVIAQIEEGKLGPPLACRIELVCHIHEVLSNFYERGGRRATLLGHIDKLTRFFRWADETGHDLSLPSIEDSYLLWTDSLLDRVRVNKDLSETVAYDYGSVIGWALDRVLGRTAPLVRTTRLRSPKQGNRTLGLKADKQNLEQTFAFGHFLLDLADGLGLETIWGPVPVRIPLRNGQALEDWSGPVRRPRKPPNPKYPDSVAKNARVCEEHHAKWNAEKSLRTRYPLINLRIQAEMFMLMGQPAVNLAQTHQLRMDQWRYKPSTNGYEVRTYKHRRWGPVVFEIYSAYRAVFERYLQWRAAIFPDDPDGLLFPLLGKKGTPSTRHPEQAPDFDKLKNACTRAGVVYLPPSALRSTNVNWMLRRTQNPDLTAEAKQHAVKTLLGTYEKPSLQRAMVQISGYWAKHDPAQTAAGPGACSAHKYPEPIAHKPATATEPDCIAPAGCLFCSHQRDIDSFDHVWSLASFRVLKSFELSRQALPNVNAAASQHPAEAAIYRITAKLNFISNSSPQRGDWVKEALVRVEEGRYHSSWADLIESL
jgi:hypothetical protein